MRRWIVLGVLLAGCGQECPVIDGNELWVRGPATSLSGPCAGTDLDLFNESGSAYLVLRIVETEAPAGRQVIRGYLALNPGEAADWTRPELYDATTHECVYAGRECAETLALDCEALTPPTPTLFDGPVRAEVHVAPPAHDSSHYTPSDVVYWVGTASVASDACSVEYADVHMRELVL